MAVQAHVPWLVLTDPPSESLVRKEIEVLKSSKVLDSNGLSQTLFKDGLLHNFFLSLYVCIYSGTFMFVNESYLGSKRHNKCYIAKCTLSDP